MKKVKVCNAESPTTRFVARATAFMGPLKMDEVRIIKMNPNDLGSSCFEAAERQTSIPRMMKWLELGASADNEDALLLLITLCFVYGEEYVQDMAAVWARSMGVRDLFEGTYVIDPSGSRALRHFQRTLFSGSLSKNKDSALYRSFFRSSMREVHLLPLISKYLKIENIPVPPPIHPLSSLYSLRRLPCYIFQDTSSKSNLYIALSFNNQFLCFLHLLFSHLPSLTSLSFGSHMESVDRFSEIDLSYFEQVDVSKLKSLSFGNLKIKSLSPLSLCDFSSLEKLELGCANQQISELHSLEGLSDRNTPNLRSVDIRCRDLVDIYDLIQCDLTLLNEIRFSGCTSLSDLSPLSDCLLPSLKSFFLHDTNVSDISPLADIEGFSPERLCLTKSPIEDISPLQRIDLSELTLAIYLNETRITDISPLENIPFNTVVEITRTPASDEMEKRKMNSPQVIGKSSVIWRW